MRRRTRSRSKTRRRSKTRKRAVSGGMPRALIDLQFRPSPQDISKPNASPGRPLPSAAIRGPPAKLPPALHDYIEQVYKKYKAPADMSVLDELRGAFQRANSKFKPSADGSGAYPLHTLHFGPGGITHQHVESNLNGTRQVFNVFILNKTLEYARRHGLPIPTTTIHIWVSDSHPYYVDKIYERFPIMTYCNPSNMSYIMFPEITFSCLSLANAWKGECRDFNALKEIIIAHHTDKKINKVFFKGTATTKTQGRLREDLAVISAADKTKFLSVALDGDGDSYEPLYNWCKYKWLLNLPGHYPWSNRFKFLFLMKSVVVNVDVSTVGRGYTDGPYMTIANLFVTPDVDYINIESAFDNKIRPGANPSAADIAAQFAENSRVHQEIVRRTSAMTAAQYKKMSESGFKKMSAITNDVIYLYVYHLLVAHSRLIGPDSQPTKK
jgi:hypothetical protein